VSFTFLFGIKSWWRTKHIFAWLILQYLRGAGTSEKIRIPNTESGQHFSHSSASVSARKAEPDPQILRSCHEGRIF